MLRAHGMLKLKLIPMKVMAKVMMGMMMVHAMVKVTGGMPPRMAPSADTAAATLPGKAPSTPQPLQRTAARG